VAVSSTPHEYQTS